MPVLTRALGIAALFLSTSASAQELYFTSASTDTVNAFNVNTGAVRVVYPSASGILQGPAGLALSANGNLYFGGGNSGAFYGGAIDGSSAPAEVPGLGALCCEALDITLNDAAGVAYTANDDGGVGIVALDGSGPAVSLGVGFDTKAVYFDETTGRLFASAENEGIYEVDPTTGATTLIATSSSPRGLTYDPRTDTVYWANQGANPSIQSAPASGGPATVLFPAVKPYDVTIGGDDLYWSEFDGGTASTNGRIVFGPLGGGAPIVAFEGIEAAGIRGVSFAPTTTAPSIDFAITGTCNTGLTFTATGLPPNGSFAMVTSQALGDAAVPGGPCAGTPSGLSPQGASVVNVFSANAMGVFSVSPPSIPAAACGAPVQLLDVQSCAFSNVTRVPQP
jgi:hypothetical protein